ncbi:MAG: choice-of-anchor Q domain-containing protein [Phycisphaerales bacterium]
MSHALTMLSALFVCTGFASAQFSGMEDGARIGIMGPDGQMEFLPTAEEMAAQMAELNDRSPDFSAIAAYAQRRIELLGLVSEIVYVDDDAPVGGDGTSWQTAHQSLQDALAQDYSDRLVKIRMAQGTYRADRFSGVNTMDPNASFSPRYTDSGATPNGILRITGGFAGLGAEDPNQRDPELFPTIITGDLKGNDGPDYENYDDNTLALFKNFNTELHGLVMENAVQAMRNGGSTIDGCLVQYHAGANNEGATALIATVLVVKRSTFYNNRSSLFGGAIYSSSPNTILVSNRFLSNRGQHGGAVFGFTPGLLSTTVLQNNYFAGNIAEGPSASVGGAAAIYSVIPIYACNTFAFNASLDGPGGGVGRIGGLTVAATTALDVYHMNEGHTGMGLSEQFPSLSYTSGLENTLGPISHDIRGNFIQDWESSESNRPGTHASTLDSIRDNSGEEILFVDLAGSDGVIGTLDDDPTPRPDSPNIDRVVDLEAAEIALLDFADLNENGIVHEPLPFDLLGNPRSINTPGIGDPDGGIDAGAIEYAGDPARFDYDRLISGRRTDPMDGCEGDEPIRLYVNASGPVSGDGSSWDSPLLELTEALDFARTRCGPVEIWLAAGTYLPDFSVPLWRVSFRPTSNATILGGFAGWETKAAERDPKTNRSILSGDHFGNDDLEDTNTLLDNAYRVVVATGERGGGVLDGLTIRGGYARRACTFAGFVFTEGCTAINPLSSGAGITALNGTLTVRNCIITGCGAYGGVALTSYGIATVELEESTVTEGHFVNPGDNPFNRIFAITLTGVDSILVPPAEMSWNRVSLAPSASTNAFQTTIGANANLTVRQSDVNVRLLGLNSSLPLQLRELRVESSLLRGVSSVQAARIVVNESTLVGNFLTVAMAPRAPSEVSAKFRNSIVASPLVATTDFQPYAQAVNCIYPATNLQTRINEILVTSPAGYNSVFVDAFGPSGTIFIPDGDYRLAPGSPAINTGLNEFVTSEFDLDGNPRIIGSVVDRGAYEFTGTCTGDVNGDGVVNLADLNLVLGNFGTQSFRGDANGDGVVDMTDLSIVLAAFGQTCAE